MLFDQFVSAHQGEYAAFALIQIRGFDLPKKADHILSLQRNNPINPSIQLNLKFIYLLQINLIIIHVYLGHYLSICVTKLCKDLF